MTTTNTSSRKLSSQERKHDTSSFKRRLKAASLDDETMPDDIDEFRYQVARRIAMFLNQWHGCRELICQCNRGCMAPNNTCANLPRPSAEEMEREWPRVQAEFHKALNDYLARHGVLNE